ncbi:MAG: PD-(D/E)XK nuclease family protein [Bacilli bacterium]|nr:PD-(D/E)XK nuclease family protein [Bacilli bacterium]
MKETIVYSNLLNQTELLRSLSLNGVNSFNYRVYRFNDLLENAHLRLGAFNRASMVNQKDALFLLESFIRDIYSFSSFTDVRHAFNTIHDLRMNITSDDEFKEFQDKVASKLKANQNINILTQIYQKYLEELNKRSLCDDVLLAKSIIKQNKKIYEEICILEEETLTPLEILLLNTLGTIKKVSLVDLYHKTLIKDAKVDTIKAYYGEKSEIDGILSDIAEHKYPLDSCLIVLAKKDKYVHLLNEDSRIYNIPMTFECGLPIHLSTPYSLYQLLDLLKNQYFYDVNGYLRLLKASCFKSDLLVKPQSLETVANLLGRWKVSYDKNSNDAFLANYQSINPIYRESFIDKVDHRSWIKKEAEQEALHALEEFSNGLPYIIKNYTNIPSDSYKDFNELASTYILDTINQANGLVNKSFINTYLEEMKDKYLLGKAFKSGALHVTTISRALSTVRPHIYIVGLSAANFPGKPIEDYLMNNEAYHLLTGSNSKSDERIIQKREYLISLINIYKSLGVNVHLTYSCKNIEEVKDVNPSSVVFEYAHKIGFSIKDSRESAKQFDNQISSLRKMSELFKDNKEISIVRPNIAQPLHPNDLLTKGYSPSALSTYLKCKLRFYLTNVLYADKPREYDAISIFQGGVFGDLVHLVMETYANNKNKYPTEESFIALADELFEAYIKFNVPLVNPNDQYDDFILSCVHAYNAIKDYEFVGAEIEIKDQDILGIKFHSSIDLLVKDPNTGDYIIFDYKSAKSIDHANNDFIQDIQGIIYAYLLEKEKGIKVKRVSFIYTRFNKIFTYEDPFSVDTQNKLKDLISEFTDTIKNKSFPIPVFNEKVLEEDVCKYCNYEHICHKGK